MEEVPVIKEGKEKDTKKNSSCKSSANYYKIQMLINKSWAMYPFVGLVIVVAFVKLNSSLIP